MKIWSVWSGLVHQKMGGSLSRQLTAGFSSLLLSLFSCAIATLPPVMLLPTAIILVGCAISCELRSAGLHASNSHGQVAAMSRGVIKRVARSISSGYLTTKTGIGRPGRFGSSNVSRVLTLNYVSSPKSYGYRRSYSVPEPLLCIGGNDHCSFVPTSVLCYHKSEGSGWRWQCESEQMNSTLCFGSVEITCDSEIPSEFIWTSGERTPCRMLYTINRLGSRDPYEKQLQCSATHYDADEVHTGRWMPGILSLTLIMLLIGLIFFALFMLWFSREDLSTIPKLPSEHKTSTASSNSSDDSSLYPPLSKEINYDKPSAVSIHFKQENSAPTLRSHSR